MENKKREKKLIRNIDDCNDIYKYDELTIDFTDNLIDIIEKLKYYNNKIIINIDISKNNYDILSELKKYNLNIYINYTTSCCDNTLNRIDCCSLDEFLNMELILNRYVEMINSKDYTILEKCIYAYDIVKLQSYKYTSDYDDKHIMIHKTINDIYHVCGSFAKMLNIILAKLNINSIVYQTKYYYPHNNITQLHYQIVCYLQDKENNINGIYYLNPTSDLVGEFKSYNYDNINRYGSFMITPNKIFHFKFQEVVSCATCIYIDHKLDYLLDDKIKNDSIILYEKLLGIKINSYEELINITSGMMGKIYPKTIIDTILNVRVKEGLINNDKDYNNTKNSIIDTFIYHENKKMNKYSHYIFFDDNKLLKDICMIDDNFEFTYNQIYNRNKTI